MRLYTIYIKAFKNGCAYRNIKCTVPVGTLIPLCILLVLA